MRVSMCLPRATTSVTGRPVRSAVACCGHPEVEAGQHPPGERVVHALARQPHGVSLGHRPILPRLTRRARRLRAAEQRPGDPGLHGDASLDHERQGDQREQADAGGEQQVRAAAGAQPDQLGQRGVVRVVPGQRPLPQHVAGAADGRGPPADDQPEGGGGDRERHDAVHQVQPAARVGAGGEHPADGAVAERPVRRAGSRRPSARSTRDRSSVAKPWAIARVSARTAKPTTITGVPSPSAVPVTSRTKAARASGKPVSTYAEPSEQIGHRSARRGRGGGRQRQCLAHGVDARTGRDPRPRG